MGPQVDSIAGRSSAALDDKYKLLVKRDFNFNKVYTPTGNQNSDWTLGNKDIYPLPWSECSYGFTTINSPN